jgi:hypothetical protein
MPTMIGKHLHTWGWSETELDERLAFHMFLESGGAYTFAKLVIFKFRNLQKGHRFCLGIRTTIKKASETIGGQQFQCTHFGIYTNTNLAAIMRLDLSCFLDLKPFYVWDFGGPVTILLDLRF